MKKYLLLIMMCGFAISAQTTEDFDWGLSHDAQIQNYSENGFTYDNFLFDASYLPNSLFTDEAYGKGAESPSTITIEGTAANFELVSIDMASFRGAGAEKIQFVGIRDGATVASHQITIPWSVDNVFTIYRADIELGSTIIFGNYQNLDELRFEKVESDFQFVFDNFKYNSVVPLPVELTSFSAAIIDDHVSLIWQTATEVNNYGFEIERQNLEFSSQKSEWSKIGFVPGHGNSNSPKEYSFTDKPTGDSDFKYRLKQIDIDGQYEYSQQVEVKLEVPEEFSLKQNYPNPFNPTTKIEFSIPSDNNVEIKMFNVQGMEVATLLNEQRQSGIHNIEFNAGNLASGIYFYKIVSGNYSEIKKMILLR
jgi:Secretion system C-terminal sorting domain